jgi:CO/xanthine dehydrogenase FAD-binding subunit
MLNSFELLTPKTLDEAIKMLVEHDDCKVLAGGTDVFVEMHAGKEYPCLMDIKQIEELKGISWSEQDGLCIGALTTFSEIERSEAVQKNYPALIDSAKKTGSVQVRMRATLAGNIVTASPSACNLAVSLAYNAVLRLKGPNGIREIPIAEFFTGVKTCCLYKGELLTHILMQAPQKNTGSAYVKLTRRKAMDIALIGIASRIVCDEQGICTLARIALTGSATTPIRAYEAEASMVGKVLSEEAIENAAKLAYKIAKPRKGWRRNEEYSKDMVLVMVPRSIAVACERMNKGER